MFLNASIEVILLIYQSLERICTQNEGGRVCLYSNGAIGKKSLLFTWSIIQVKMYLCQIRIVWWHCFLKSIPAWHVILHCRLPVTLFDSQ